MLVSTAHDEPAIRLEIFKDVFSRPAALCYLTDSERQFVQAAVSRSAAARGSCRRRRRHPAAAAVPADAGGRRRRCRAGRGDARQPPTTEDAPADEFPSHLLARGAVFRRRHRLYGPIVLYGGRIDPGKGCEELIEYFSSYVKEGGDATLALMGVKLMALPEEPFIRFAGLLSDRERVQALEAATVVVCPSPYESLSLLALEALSVGTPVLVNARSAVLVEHCVTQQRRPVLRRPRRVRRVPEAAGRRRSVCARRWAATAATTSAATTGGTSCSASTSGSSRRSGTRGRSAATCRRTVPASADRRAGSAPDGAARPVPALARRRSPCRFRRGRMSYRLIISFSVVGLMCSSSAARFCTPPAASSVDSISRFSKSVITSLNEMPSGGTTNCGIVEVRRLADVIRNQLDADPRPGRQHDGALDDVLELADVARPVVLGQQIERVRRQLEIRSSGSRRRTCRRKCCASSGMSSLRSRSGGS